MTAELDTAEEAAACARLWRAALAAGLADAARGDAEALLWLGSADFRSTAELAGFDPAGLDAERLAAFVKPPAAPRRPGGGRPRATGGPKA